MWAHQVGKVDSHGAIVSLQGTDHFLIAEAKPTLYFRSSNCASHLRHRMIQGTPYGRLLLVARGVGNTADGERASEIVVETVAQSLLSMCIPARSRDDSSTNSIQPNLMAAFDDCRQSLQTAASAPEQAVELAAVVTLVYLMGPYAYILHAGNNRAYHYRNGRLKQVTRDHTLASRLVQSGTMNARRITRSRLRNVVWNTVGTSSPDIKPDFHRLQLREHDGLLLCSQALPETISDATIGRCFAATTTAEETCQQLIRHANDGAPRTDVTVLVARRITPRGTKGG